MGLFGSSSDDNIVVEVEKATNEKNVEEDWGTIMIICDKAAKNSEEAKAYLRAIVKRLYNSDPHIGLKAVTLLDACVKNSGKTFHIELASREFESDFTKLMTKAATQVAKKLRESLKKWVENEFKTDPQLNLIPSMYNKLKSQFDFTQHDTTPIKKPTVINKDPDVVESQEEEDQILKAIELSLKETKLSTPASAVAATSLYPSMSMATPSTPANSASNSAPSKEQRKVRALYDFEAAEDNELTFTSGEIILIIDDSDRNWWKGSNHRGEGLFPANFVTTDLSVEPDKYLYEKAKKVVQFKENAEVNLLEQESTSSADNLSIDEGKIDRLMHLLHEADPTNPEKDTQEFLNLEREVISMGPLVDAELERVDRKHAQLTQLSSDLVEAFSLYHTLMREPQFSTMGVVKQPFSPYHPGMAPNGGMPPPHLMGPPQHYNLPPQQHSMQHLPPQPVSHPIGHLPPGVVPNVGPSHMPQGPPMHGMPHPHMLNEQYASMHNFPPGAGMIPMGMHQHLGNVVPQNPPQQPQQQQPQQLPPHYTTSSTHIMH